jgi:hypothetical protein
MSIYLIVIILLILIVAFVFYTKNNKQTNPAKKKIDIQNEYIAILKTKKTKEEKIAFIKQCNSELSRNIFFTKQEADNLIQKLINL